MLPGLAGGLDDLDMKHVRGGDDDDVDVRVADGLPPVGDRLAEAEPLDRLVAARFHAVGADDELRMCAAVGKERGDAGVGAAVRLSHPAEADHRDPDAPSHAPSSAVISGLRGSGSIPFQVSRIQACGGSSTIAIVRSGLGPAMTLR